MKRNKIMSLAAASVLALTILAGCGSNDKDAAPASDYKDGKYRAEYDQIDKNGWKAFVELTVKDGKIAEVDYDYLNDKEERKSENEAYNTKMKEVAGTNPEAYLPELEKALVDKQDASKIDNITGATHSVDGFKEMVAKLVDEKIKKGDETTLVIAQPSPAEEVKLTDGTYKAEYDKFDSHSWKAFTEITVKDGKIAEVNFDYVNDKGEMKSESAEYNESMKKVSGTNPEEFTPVLEKALVDSQDPSKVDTVTGATSSSNDFKALATKLISEKIAKGDTTTLVVELPAE
ncbi:FMN-binding protein [Alloiococcus sp. CFN-8]|uniref:FMN-binding protein n=1 Tax=Alloiococcus sp. CFN-8 TaxID=3416081 RepID=UPI003CE9742E